MQEKILYALKSQGGYSSGEELSRGLRVSRAAVWKYVQELRRLGYKIEAVPRQGYKLLSSPDKLYPWEIQPGLQTKVIGRQIRHCEVLPSTMDEAFRLATEGAAEGTVVCAEGQTAGRGRMGRSWSSPKAKGLYLSVILRPCLPSTDMAKLTLLAAVSVCRAINKSASAQGRIKWPNDVLLNGRKLAGILTELHGETDRVKFIILGIGVNVNTPAAALPAGATSLQAALGRTFPRVAVLKEILTEMEGRYLLVQEQGFEPVLAEWKELATTIGKKVRVSDQSGAVAGTAVDLAPDGGLVIRSERGELIKRMSGDVVELS